MKILARESLIAHLHSPSPRVRMWATYHLAERWQEHIREFASLLIESDLPEVRESGVYLIGKHQLHEFEFPLFRIFSSSQGSLRKAAALALAEMGYLNLRRPLWHWLEDLLRVNESNTSDLQSAAECLLVLDVGHWEELAAKLVHYQNRHVTSLALFGVLCESTTTAEQLQGLLGHYLVYRAQFNDPQFLQYFLHLFENQELIELLRVRTSYGYSMRLIYHECLNLLGVSIPPAIDELLAPLDASSGEIALPHLTELLQGILQHIFGEDSASFLETSFLQNFQPILEDWQAAILKIQEQEFFFLLSLPLLCCLKMAEQECLEAPEKNVARIARLYHSPLLRPSFMIGMLNLLAERLSSPLPSAAILPLHEHPREALWQIVSGPLTSEDHLFPNVLPRPWKYDVPVLIPRLVTYYKQKFDHFVRASQNDQVAYALELFKRQADDEIIELTSRNFTYLINHHFHSFFEFLEQFPELRFLEQLIQHYRPGEREIAELIEFVCDIHGHPKPMLPEGSEAPMREQTHGTYARILCPQCHTSYRYHLHVLYFDQEVLEQRRPFTNQDLWTTEPLLCKHCSAPLPFETSEDFRSNLFAEMLTARLLKLTEEEQKIWGTFKPLTFPRYLGTKTHPGIFLKKVQADLLAERLPKTDQGQLLLELGKLDVALEKLTEARDCFQKALHLLGNQPAALFNLGVIAFREKNLHDARLYFSRLRSLFSHKDFETSPENWYELAGQYLELLDRREVRRSSFKLISS